MKPCAHENFYCHAAVNRIVDTGRFSADITIKCSQCDEPFRFIGVQAGVTWDRPACSIDGLELRAPIEPQGTPRLQTNATFEMLPKEPVQ